MQLQDSLPIKPKIAWSNESQTFSKQNEKDPIQILETGRSLEGNFQSKVAFIAQEMRADSFISDTWIFVSEELKPRLFSVFFYFSWLFDVFLAMLFVAGLTHIPHHNIVFEPKYWYESPLIASYTWCITDTCHKILHFHHGVGLPNVMTLSNFVIIYLLEALLYHIMYYIYYYVWVIVYEFYPPLPFNAPFIPQLTATFTCMLLLVEFVWKR